MSRPDDPGVIRGVYGTINSLDLSKHRCILRMEKRRMSFGNGILDTTELEESLVGVSDLRSFLPVGTQFITKLKPLTPERAKELDWNDGRYEAMWIRPKGIKPDISWIPGRFVTRGRIGEPSTPTLEYCQQGLVAPSGRPGAPPEKVADAISAFRKILKHWDVFPLPEILRVLRNREEFADLRPYFTSTQDIVSFTRSFPQYFLVPSGDRALGFPWRFSEGDYKRFLKQQAQRTPRSDAPPPYVLITDVEACQQHVRTLQDRAKEKNGLVIAMDCEGVHLGKDGALTLLQIGTVEGEVFVFDILATPDRGDMFVKGGLKGLLEDPAIVKVIHDCRTDQCALHFQFGVTLKNVFDTSAAYTTIWEQCNVISGPYRPKLSALLEIYGLKADHKTEEFIKRVHDDGIFGERPLTKEVLEYATEDVLCLVPVIHDNLNRLISPLWRPHFERKIELALAESRVTDPHQMYEKKGGQK